MSVIADRCCGALEWSRLQADIKSDLVDLSQSQEVLREMLIRQKPDVVLTFIHKILNDDVLSSPSPSFVNTHYSLLPSYKGTIGDKTVCSAVNDGVRIIGASCHRVTSELDSGPIISQVAFGVPGQCQKDRVMQQMFGAGCLSTYLAVREVLGGTHEKYRPANISLSDCEYLASDYLDHDETSVILKLLGS